MHFSYHTHLRPVLVEFRSASSEGSWRKKKKKKIERIAVKPKSADKQVGWPNKLVRCCMCVSMFGC